ncbi:MAG: DUF6288 domain-containing protein, partial [Planctomycetota bacterium]|nr:DUF6288 domain-containing protein [Planctomycetota bacterium]
MTYGPPARNLFNLHAKGGFWTIQYLLASGDPRALELARRGIYSMVKSEYKKRTDPWGNCWVLSYKLVTLCEYYLLTGDSAVLPAIRFHADQLSLNQYPMGTWGHGAPSGYGPINNVGLVCFIGLILARECGVHVDHEVMCRAIRFFGKFCGTNFPYGEGSPGGRSGRMDNGMNSSAAVAFHLLGEEQMARRWATSVCYMWMGRERGHAEGIFNFVWGPLGAVHAPRDEFHMFMNNMLWYYELMRTRDGGFVFSRYGSAGGGRFRYPAGSTPAIGLFLYLPQRKLRILGAPKSPFSHPVPDGLELAVRMLREKKWKELKVELSRLRQSTDARQKKYAGDLEAVYGRMEESVEFALGLIRQNIEGRKQATAEEQLNALKKLLGEERPAMARLRESLSKEPKDTKTAGQPAASHPEWMVYRKLGPRTPIAWQTVLPLAADSKQPYRYFSGEGGASPGSGQWWEPDAGEDGWKVQTGPLPDKGQKQYWLRRTFQSKDEGFQFLRILMAGEGSAEIYLNGYRIADDTGRPGRGSKTKVRVIDLGDLAGGAVRSGKNVLAAHLTNGAADIGLEAGPQKVDIGALRKGLASYWKFDEGQGSAFSSLLPKKIDGLARTDVQWPRGKFGTAVRALRSQKKGKGFQGLLFPDTGKTGQPLRPHAGLTISMWFRPEPIHYNTISFSKEPRNGRAGWRIEMTKGALKFSARTVSGLRVMAEASLPEENRVPTPFGGLDHWAVAHDGNRDRILIFCNGQKLAESKLDSSFAKASKQILGSGRAAGNKEAEELDLLEDEVGEENGEETSQEVDPHSIEPTRTPLSMTAPRAVV